MLIAAAPSRKPNYFEYSIPIVYLSAEEDKVKQLAAMRLGGDDFLTKPIQAGHLISIVTSRVQRSRILRSYIVKDSLTGLLNHTTIRQALNHKVNRARRQHLSLSFIMLDIDHFKKVNDTYGHLIGDKVIQSLFNLLCSRLRKTDLIGRYGGEEFAIVLPNTEIEACLTVLDKIHEQFFLLKHYAAEHSFNISFSAGIACYTVYDDPTELIESAAKAFLYSQGNRP